MSRGFWFPSAACREIFRYLLQDNVCSEETSPGLKKQCTILVLSEHFSFLTSCFVILEIYKDFFASILFFPVVSDTLFLFDCLTRFSWPPMFLILRSMHSVSFSPLHVHVFHVSENFALPFLATHDSKPFLKRCYALLFSHFYLLAGCSWLWNLSGRESENVWGGRGGESVRGVFPGCV